MSTLMNYTAQYSNVTNIQAFFDNNPNKYELQSQNLNWTNWTDTLSTLAFNSSKTNFGVIQYTIDSYFRSSIFSYPVLCTYPISGQYGFLPRLAYYLLLLFSLALRKHEWLSTAALGTAMVYAATTCVHAFALLM